MSNIRFLIADYSQGVQTFMRQKLESFGFQPDGIKTTSTPQAAADTLPELKPDFLLTCWFPKEPLSGFALFEKALQFNPGCHFALISQEVTPDHELRAAQAGAMFLLRKPFTVDQISEALRLALEKLAITHPKMVRHVNASLHTTDHAMARTPSAAPPIQCKPGDSVIYQNQRETVQYVILRHDELVVQLKGHRGLVAARDVSRA